MSTGISYCDETWNPCCGCSPISEGCQNCWAATFAARELCDQHKGLTHMDATGHRRWNGRVNTVSSALDKPFGWKTPKVILTPSMSDYFQDAVPAPLVSAAFRVMEDTPQHTYLFLTKRLDGWDGYAWKWLLRQKPLPNVLIGVTVENQRRADERLPLLAKLAAVGWRTWISVEPMISDINLRQIPLDAPHLQGERGNIEFVAVGGETGPGARFCDINWIGSVIQQCRAAGTKVHLKQLGANRNWPKGWKLRSRTGADPDEWADYMKQRDMP
jgi:protein gp37